MPVTWHHLDQTAQRPPGKARSSPVGHFIRSFRTVFTAAKSSSLLTGMVFDETVERLTPTYAVKEGNTLSVLAEPTDRT
jgi:hypothetical protein